MMGIKKEKNITFLTTSFANANFKSNKFFYKL